MCKSACVGGMKFLVAHRVTDVVSRFVLISIPLVFNCSHFELNIVFSRTKQQP